MLYSAETVFAKIYIRFIPLCCETFLPHTTKVMGSHPAGDRTLCVCSMLVFSHSLDVGLIVDSQLVTGVNVSVNGFIYDKKVSDQFIISAFIGF